MSGVPSRHTATWTWSPSDFTIGRGVFEPGWRWSNDVKPIAGTDSCQTHHTGLYLARQMTVQFDDGTQLSMGPATSWTSTPDTTPGPTTRSPAYFWTPASRGTPSPTETPQSGEYLPVQLRPVALMSETAGGASGPGRATAWPTRGPLPVHRRLDRAAQQRRRRDRHHHERRHQSTGRELARDRVEGGERKRRRIDRGRLRCRHHPVSSLVKASQTRSHALPRVARD